MSGRNFGLWWPVPVHPGDTPPRVRVEVVTALGAYNPGERTPAGDTMTLQWPYGTLVWPTPRAHARAVAAAAATGPGLPPGFALDATMQPDGRVTFTARSDEPDTRFRFVFDAATRAGAALLGFNPDAVAAFAPSQTGDAPHACAFALAADPGAALTACDGPHTVYAGAPEVRTFAGTTAGTAWGGAPVLKAAFDYLSAGSVAALAAWHAYAARGGPFAVLPRGPADADAALDYTLDAASRRSFDPERPRPGLARFRYDFTCVGRAP